MNLFIPIKRKRSGTNSYFQKQMASPIALNSIEQKNLPLGSSSNLKMDQFSTCQLSKPSGSLSNVSVKLDFFFIREGKKLRVQLWQYGLWSFQTGGTKLERVLPKNQHTQRKLLNFKNWVNENVSKIIRIFLNFFFIEEYQFRSTFLLLTFFANINI